MRILNHTLESLLWLVVIAEDDGYEKPFIFYDKSEVEQITTIAAEIQNYSEL